MSRCPCGSALPEPDAVGLITCRVCGRVSRADDGPDATDATDPQGRWRTSLGSDVENGPPPDGRVPWAGRSLDTTTVARRGKGCALMALAVVFFIALGIAVAGFIRVRNEASDESRRPDDRIVVGGSVVSLGAATSAGAIAVVQDYTDTSHRYLARLDLRGRRITALWRSPEVPAGIDRVNAKLIDGTVMVTFDDQLWALDADRGTRRWAATLSSQVAADCGSCLAAAGGGVVVRTDDAFMTGFGLDGPAPRWHRRLASTSAAMRMLGPTLVAVDETTDAPGASVRSIDPVTGEEGVRFRPACPSLDPARIPIPLSLGDAVLAVPGTGDAVSVSAYGDGCAVRWEVATGTLRWAARIDGLTSVDAASTLVSASDLVVARSGGGLLQVDLATSVVRSFDVAPGRQAKPALLVGRRVLAWTTGSTRGRAATELQAFDLVSGAQQWAARLPGDPEPASSRRSTALAGRTGRAVLVPDGERVDVTLFTHAGHRLDIGRLDLASGSVDLQPPQQYRVRYDRPAGVLDVEVAGAGMLLVTIDDVLERIDASSGATTSYP